MTAPEVEEGQEVRFRTEVQGPWFAAKVVRVHEPGVVSLAWRDGGGREGVATARYGWDERCWNFPVPWRNA